MGPHLITVTVTDLGGLSTSASMEIEIKIEPADDTPKDPEGKDEGLSIALIIFILTVIIILIFLVYLFRKKTRSYGSIEE